MTKWKLVQETANLDLMSETLAISKTMAQIMVNRNIRTKKTAVNYLNPTLFGLHDIFLMKDVDKAIKIIVNSVLNGGKIAVYGDYDVDGIMSVAILYKTLRMYGADVMYYIPDRESEGYGLNLEAVNFLRGEGVTLLITCDNGIAAIEEIHEAKRLGLDVIVIDHHEPGFFLDENNVPAAILPKADAIIDPKRYDCPYPFKKLCAAGITYKFAQAFCQYMEIKSDNDSELLVFAMLATYCDIVDLIDENRIIVKHGLKILNNDKTINKGLHALIKAKGLSEKELNGFSVGFILGPCINASGRLDKATAALSLMLCENERECDEIALKLADLNEERKQMTLANYEDALLLIEKTDLKNHKVLVLLLPEAHESIAGIVAGRIKDHYHKPAIVLTKSGDIIKGSARSIEGYNIFEALYECRHLFIRFGGHEAAAGLSISPENVPILRRYLNEKCNLTEDDFVEIIKYDKELELSEITYELAEELLQLAPFGKANKEPVFVTKGITPSKLFIYQNKNTIIFQFDVPGTNRKIKAVCFGLVDRLENDASEIFGAAQAEKIMCGVLRGVNIVMDIIYLIEINEYNGDKSVQIRIKDYVFQGK